MILEKVLLVLYKNNTTWSSCKDINSGLVEVYTKVFKETHLYYATDDPHSGKNLSKLVQEKDFDKIIFVDHRLRIQKELHYVLKDLEPDELKNYHFLFHVYGCFIGRMPEWDYIANKLSQCKVDFVTGSWPQKKMVESTLKLKGDALLLPFPVEDNKFLPIKTLSKSQLGIEDRTKVVLYAGRISPGKNVLPLCDVIKLYNKTHQEKIHLIIIGSIDDMGWPSEENWARRGSMCNSFAQKLNDVNIDIQNVTYIPNVEDKSLLYAYYGIADVIASLSTMLFEDYGMAIADALALNKKVICTDWGGYRGFREYSKNIHFIPVTFESDNFCFDLSDVCSLLHEVLQSKIEVEYSGELSPEKLSIYYEKQLSDNKSQYSGLNKLGQMCKLYKRFEIIRNKNLRSVYEPYWL